MESGDGRLSCVADEWSWARQLKEGERERVKGRHTKEKKSKV